MRISTVALLIHKCEFLMEILLDVFCLVGHFVPVLKSGNNLFEISFVTLKLKINEKHN